MRRKRAIAAVSTLFLGAALAAAVPAAAGAATNPTVIPNGAFSAVAAAGPSDVWAVGYVWNSTISLQSNLAEHWNGKTWTRVTVPLPTRTGGGVSTGGLTSVAVYSATDAWAIGGIEGYDSQAAHWNGKTWTQVPLPVLKIGTQIYPITLDSVSIASATSVWAVGYWGPDPSALILHWNGKAWAHIPTPASAASQNLLAVTTISGSNAWAVGSTTPTTISDYSDLPLSLHWNGKVWSRVSAPVPVGEDDAEAAESVPAGLTAVENSSAAGLWTLGNFNQGQPYVVRWKGGKWVSVPVPSELLTTTYPIEADALAIPSASSVWVAGSGYPYQAAHWNGKKWSLLRIGPETGGIAGLASTSASSVWAVGYTSVQKEESGESFSAIYHWNGKAWAQTS
jgi:hypothetical protein